MLCEQCKSREATFHRVVVVNGKRGETHLCAECLQQTQQANMPEMMASFFTPATRSAYTCAHCGSTLSSFQQTGRLGCASCYSAFPDAMQVILRRIHGATQHVGRMHGAAQAGGAPTQASSAAAGSVDSAAAGGAAAAVDKARQAAQLRAEIREAVAKEDYERAAQLRDKIRDLEKEGA